MWCGCWKLESVLLKDQKGLLMLSYICSPFKLFYFIYIMCMLCGRGNLSWCMHDAQWTILWILFSPSISVWVLGIELQSPGYVVSSFTWWAIYLAHTDLRFVHSEVYSLKSFMWMGPGIASWAFPAEMWTSLYSLYMGTDDRLMKRAYWISAGWIKEFRWLTHSVEEELLTEVQVISTVAWIFHKLVIII